MANIVWTDHIFDTEKAARDYIGKYYTVDKNSIMKQAKKTGKKVSVGVRKSKGKFVIVIVVG